ncbi:MAG TPA: hypothetical protein VHB30_00760 [Solirubrobacteraceae bacterium]|nr:hypothetical protein [Solirubrobacteraceae bacterium]
MSNLLNIEPGLHESVERTLGTGDMRLVYGLGVPVFSLVAVIVAACVWNTIWFAVLALVAVVACAFGILQEIGHMLDDEDDAEA